MDYCEYCPQLMTEHQRNQAGVDDWPRRTCCEGYNPRNEDSQRTMRVPGDDAKVSNVIAAPAVIGAGK